MAVLTLLCQWKAPGLVHFFTRDPEVIRLGGEFLRIISWNFVSVGLVFTCSSLFQALGNTWPALLSTASRLLLFALPAVWLGRQPGFQLVHVWYLSVATVPMQAVISLLLLRRQLRLRLGSMNEPMVAAPVQA